MKVILGWSLAGGTSVSPRRRWWPRSLGSYDVRDDFYSCRGIQSQTSHQRRAQDSRLCGEKGQPAENQVEKPVAWRRSGSYPNGSKHTLRTWVKLLIETQIDHFNSNWNAVRDELLLVWTVWSLISWFSLTLGSRKRSRSRLKDRYYILSALLLKITVSRKNAWKRRHFFTFTVSF